MERRPGSTLAGDDDVRSAVALYHRWIKELWGGERIARELVSDDFVGHWPTFDVHGPDQLQAIIDDTRARLRELLYVISVGPLVDGDLVSARWISTGATTSGPARFTGNDILRVADGRIVEFWSAATPA
ncbi:ester cyclase [Mycolicibacterium sp. 018/SC-01/001]|uniref:ester cyclase n=1 Tax=Mycolicibacterium sp. 018/SC-01/001 TaxID=2592069 RepID=UPI00117E0AC7|nr:nuclear transport factor 2 family protein [Mycolicibacterium sp. 018/SC-01/001]TRW86374.1 ester cyclase [Mycolicibacterium sp. 018/SC-01/001]